MKISSQYPTRLLSASLFAIEAHAGQLRTSTQTPYVAHPIRVAYLAEVSGLPEAAVIAALLHDVLEDTPTKPESILSDFGAEVLSLVTLLTKSTSVSKEDYYARIRQSPEAAALKLLDRADNLVDMISVPNRRWAEKYLKKTHEEFPPLVATVQDGPYRVVVNTFQQAVGDLTASFPVTV